MKDICVSMDKREEVLHSYLARVFSGQVIEKKTVKVIHFTEDVLEKKGWTKSRFLSFCDLTTRKDRGYKFAKVYKAIL